MGGGLYDPLGRDPRVVGARRSLPIPLVVAGVVAAAVVIFGIVVALRGGDERGEPRAVVTIERPPPTPAPAAPVAIAPPQQAPPAATASIPPLPTATHDADVEIQNGVRIIRMRPASSHPESQTTTAPQGAPPSAAH